MDSLACLPLSKLSYATTSGVNIKPVPWQHVSDRGHLFAVFSDLPVVEGESGEKRHFKVLSGPTVMVCLRRGDALTLSGRS